jgi:hypothetical protein
MRSKLAAIILVLGLLTGCAAYRWAFPPAPPTPPEWAALTLLEPVRAKCDVLDDAGQHVEQTYTIPAGWRLLKPKPMAVTP